MVDFLSHLTKNTQVSFPVPSYNRLRGEPHNTGLSASPSSYVDITVGHGLFLIAAVPISKRLCLEYAVISLRMRAQDQIEHSDCLNGYISIIISFFSCIPFVLASCMKVLTLSVGLFSFPSTRTAC